MTTPAPIANPTDATQPVDSPGLIRSALPSFGQFWDRFKTIAPPAAAIGVGGASLMQLLKSLHDERIAQAQAKPRKDVLTVELDPQKQANLQQIQNSLGDAFHGAQESVGNAVNNFKTWAQKPYDQSAERAVSDPNKVEHPMTEDAMRLAIAIGSVSAGAAGTNAFFNARRKADLQTKLDRAKSEYSSMLGQSLMGGPAGIKTAGPHIDCEICPTISGMFDAIAHSLFPEETRKLAVGNILSNALNAPATLFTLSAILSHKFMYNRLKEQEKVEQAETPAPPREIRFVTKKSPMAPAIAPAAPIPAAVNESDVITPDDVNVAKSAGFQQLMVADMLSGGALLAAEKSMDENDKEKQEGMNPPAPGAPAVPGQPKPLPKGPDAKSTRPDPSNITNPVKMVDIGPGTIAAQTNSGPVTLEADDANAAHVIAANRTRIRAILQSIQSQPAA